MKTIILRTVALALLLLLPCCSKKPVEVTGQIFVITQGRENIKMGGVKVLAMSDEDFVKKAKEVVTWMQQEAKAEAQRRVDSDHMTGFINEVLELEKTSSLKIPELPKIRESLVKESDAVSKILNSVLEGDLKARALRKLLRENENLEFTTDADGKFFAPIMGKVWFFAAAKRQVGDETEDYLWVKGFDAPKAVSSANLVISNDEDIDSEDELYAMLSSSCKLPGRLEGFREVKVSEKMKSLVTRFRKEVEEAQSKAEREAAEAKARAEREAAEAYEKLRANRALEEKNTVAPLVVEGTFSGIEWGDYAHWNIKTKDGVQRSFFVLVSDADIEKVLENPEPHVGKACRVTWKKSMEEIPEAGGQMELEQVLAVEWLKLPGSR
ncbi:MAG: hypothetical protein RLZ22_236 [Verrucomicrobiota bacterium]|jgi:tellurite resistance protein